MAEAIVDGASSMTRFFCHHCSIEIEHLLPDYTCPRCSTGFIEELERNRADGGSGMDTDSQALNAIEVDVTSFNEFPDFFESFPHIVLTNRRRRTNGWVRNPLGTDPADQQESQNSRSPYYRRSRRPRSRNDQSQQPTISPEIDSLIQDLFFNLSSIGFGFSQGQGVMDVGLFLGNPGDYVWGQNGLDTIVTQLLNQMDGTGPPPLPKNQIDEIPTTTVSQIQVDCKLQCSVCWEDFILEEPVRQLPCQHYYHAPCIVPWLELHGTCPICRQSLGDQSTSEANQDIVGSSLAALFRAANESSSSRTSSASLGNSSRNGSQNES